MPVLYQHRSSSGAAISLEEKGTAARLILKPLCIEPRGCIIEGTTKPLPPLFTTPVHTHSHVHRGVPSDLSLEHRAEAGQRIERMSGIPEFSTVADLITPESPAGGSCEVWYVGVQLAWTMV
jgi:hypothetical protein